MSKAEKPRKPGILCRACRGEILDEQRTLESHTGALHCEVRCPSCRASGGMTVNPGGAKAILERGRALRGDRL